MHLDLLPLISEETICQLDAIAANRRGISPYICWNKWCFNPKSRSLPIVAWQASAQYLSSWGCVFSTLAFGLYCSRHYKVPGAIISDDAAKYYLKHSFHKIFEEQGELLEWMQMRKAHCYLPFHENSFWKSACKVYLLHALALKNIESNPVIDFAISFVSSDIKKY
ncbi:hypothetical protein [Thalassotalea hakodatensis]|uniref:hypothetical protein n=1 Tax=Thalassotalea hakodatensis TaxID=3030492 RepID=UPI002573E074|nr:hypothetical protein [Thalassotalea hakodatensis]